MKRTTMIPTRQTGIAISCFLGVFVLVAGGCGSLSRPYPEKSLHAIELGRPEPSAAPPRAAVVRIDRVRIAQPYDGTTFVYKVGESAFTTDYYNGFVAAPGALFTGELIAWLGESGVFASVVSGDSAAEYQLVLESNITDLYADYTAKDSPRAVLAIRFFLIDDRDGSYRVVFQKQYRESEAIPEKTPEALIAGWRAAGRRILTALNTDLRQASASTAPIAPG